MTCLKLIAFGVLTLGAGLAVAAVVHRITWARRLKKASEDGPENWGAGA